MMEIASWTVQMMRALQHIHERGYFHRDLKPENILLAGDGTLRVADFGCAREVRSTPPYTPYFGTRWYRAPELLLKSTVYNSPVDIWAAGCVMAEMFLLEPLFPGKGGTIDQLFKIWRVFDAPTLQTWADGVKLAMASSISLPKRSIRESSLPEELMRAGATNAEGMDGFVHLLSRMLRIDPKIRPSASRCLKSGFLKRYGAAHYNAQKQLDTSIGSADGQSQTDTSMSRVSERSALQSTSPEKRSKTEQLPSTPPRSPHILKNADSLAAEAEALLLHQSPKSTLSSIPCLSPGPTFQSPSPLPISRLRIDSTGAKRGGAKTGVAISSAPDSPATMTRRYLESLDDDDDDDDAGDEAYNRGWESAGSMSRARNASYLGVTPNGNGTACSSANAAATAPVNRKLSFRRLFGKASPTSSPQGGPPKVDFSSAILSGLEDGDDEEHQPALAERNGTSNATAKELREKVARLEAELSAAHATISDLQSQLRVSKGLEERPLSPEELTQVRPFAE